jgi:hypothetical protein
MGGWGRRKPVPQRIRPTAEIATTQTDQPHTVIVLDRIIRADSTAEMGRKLRLPVRAFAWAADRRKDSTANVIVSTTCVVSDEGND